MAMLISPQTFSCMAIYRERNPGVDYWDGEVLRCHRDRQSSRWQIVTTVFVTVCIPQTLGHYKNQWGHKTNNAGNQNIEATNQWSWWELAHSPERKHGHTIMHATCGALEPTCISLKLNWQIYKMRAMAIIFLQHADTNATQSERSYMDHGN
jgi:hypothetical protein